eukprot:TRINITY_DN2872_c0_g1_i2.p1 TRINITY_DN2872_c0_g1~~TRINITY_DN2872_c0_g1_i2.p1  ORF type:complete len:245 (-),score=29.75 TRINITY_DN2872_c0_g1_i2:85-819(-)
MCIRDRYQRRVRGRESRIMAKFIPSMVLGLIALMVIAGLHGSLITIRNLRISDSGQLTGASNTTNSSTSVLALPEPTPAAVFKHIKSGSSCALSGIGHRGDQFGPIGSPIHWERVIAEGDTSQACLDDPCRDVADWCCFSRFLHVFVWYIDALTRHGVRFFLSHGSLIGSLRSGSMPPYHYDAEVHVLLDGTVEDDNKMRQIAYEADEHTEHVKVCCVLSLLHVCCVLSLLHVCCVISLLQACY